MFYDSDHSQINNGNGMFEYPCMGLRLVKMFFHACSCQIKNICLGISLEAEPCTQTSLAIYPRKNSVLFACGTVTAKAIAMTI